MTETGRYREAVLSMGDTVFLEETDSTNRVAKDLAKQGCPAGMCVFADAQTAGRGRMQRGWYSPAGRGILMSIVLRPQALPPSRSPEISFTAALAACEAFESAGENVHAYLKWPNDIIIEGKKVCGLLAEGTLSARGDYLHAVAGIGMNILGDEFPGLPHAGSLGSVCGIACERGKIAGVLVRSLRSRFSLWESEGFTPVLEACRARMLTLGKKVRAERDGECIEGIAEELRADGSLLLRTKDGAAVPLYYGEVSVRGLMGYL